MRVLAGRVVKRRRIIIIKKKPYEANIVSIQIQNLRHEVEINSRRRTTDRVIKRSMIEIPLRSQFYIYSYPKSQPGRENK